MDHMTAKVSCFARAYHYKQNRTCIFTDSAAEALLGKEYDEIARSMMNGIRFFFPEFQGSAEEGLRLIADRRLSPSVLARSAFCEKSMENEKRLGCRQCVLFAAGLDTFCVRNRDSAFAVFELDLPEMIADKKRRLKACNLKTNAVFVPCSLAQNTWPDLLTQAGFHPREKSFGSLLGISYYLSKEEFKRLLRAASDIIPAGSAICFDYPSADGGREAETKQILAQAAGEPMKARYSALELERLLQECGLLIYEHLDDKEMTKQFFSAYNRCSPEHFMQAPPGVGYVLAVKAN